MNSKRKKGTGVTEDKAKKFWKSMLFLQSSFCSIYMSPECCLCPTRNSGNFFTYQTSAMHAQGTYERSACHFQVLPCFCCFFCF